MSERLLPCPFCGTDPESKEHPASTREGGGLNIECGKCGACWPTITEKDAEALSGDGEDFIAFLNRRAPPPEEYSEYDRLMGDERKGE